MMHSKRLFIALLVLSFLISVGPVASSPLLDAPVYLHLASGSFDPLVRSSGRVREVQTAPDGYYLIQFDGPIEEKDRVMLEEAGAVPLGYVPDFAFITRMAGGAAQTLSDKEAVRWVGPYSPELRIAPSLARELVVTGSTPIYDFETAERVGEFSGLESPLAVMVLVFPGADLPATARAVETLGGKVLETAETAWRGKLHVTLDAERVAELAALPGVAWVEKAPEWVLYNEEAMDLMDVRDAWDTHGLHGAGQTVAVCDTGLDQGSTVPGSLHDDFEDGAGSSRVLSIFDLVGDGASDVNSGHGTHVAGSVLGNGVLSGATPTLSNYPATSHAGVAPEASLIFQAVENNSSGSLSGIPLDLNTLFSQAYTPGARIHTNSWGSDVNGEYTASSQEVDEFTWNNKDMLILFAAGNEGIDEDADGVVDHNSIGSPGTAKNCLTVGASENNRAGVSGATWNSVWGSDFSANPVRDDNLADDPEGLAAFSSRGPTLDGRTKPDIVAPGTFIASTRSSVASGTGWGAIDANYMYMGGTSMATPLTAGAAALFREYMVEQETYTPSAALLKAAMLNGAMDLYPGQYGTGSTQEISPTRPSVQAGWGRVNVEGALFPTGGRSTWYWDESTGYESNLNELSTGDTAEYVFEITDSDPISVTLAWTDYPGTPSAAGGLVNDLDLTVEGPGGTYYPNQANQRGASQHLYYHDGGSNGAYYWVAGARVAVRSTPSSYPVEMKSARVYVGSRTSTFPKSFNYYVYSGTDATGPQTLLASGSTTIRREGYHVIDLEDHSLTLSSDDVFFAIELPDDDLLWFIDTTSPDGRSWDYDGSTWSSSSTADYMFDLVVADADAVTSADRVNNVEGIDIPAPATGTYTVTVSGYNVPSGPQPYALVVSGEGRIVSDEVLTRTIDAPGSYVFGNTGAALDFSSESLDTVSVEVYRDTILTTSPSTSADNLVHRYYVLEGSGGTGTFIADLTLSYEDAELPVGLSESNLNLYRFRGTGLGWDEYVPTRDTVNNTLTVAGVTDFSVWAIAEATPNATGVNQMATRVSVIPLAAMGGLLLVAVLVFVLRRR